MERFISADVVELEGSKVCKCLSYTTTGNPTADVRENVHAHWVVLEDEIGLYGCSNCEHKILRKMTNYCPNCGAQMDERSDDD